MLRGLWLTGIIISCTLSSKVFAQMVSAVPAGATTGALDEAPAPMTAQFQLGISYSYPKFNMDVGGTRTLTKSPDLGAYEDSLPVSGTFKGGSSLALRTVASFLFGRHENNLSLGFGLESLELGVKERMSKGGPSSASFQANSFVIEGGVQRSVSRWTQTVLRLGLAQGLSGKLHTRYVTSSSFGDSVGGYASIDDSLKTATRLSISGQYLFNIMPSLALGLQTSAEYGIVSFQARDTKSTLFGYSWGFTALMRL